MRAQEKSGIQWKPRTVKQLALLAGVSIRTLHHYDEIGLLRPCTRSGAGYRLYGEDELLRLQQILFYRELGMGLEEIGHVLDSSDFSRAEALRTHRKGLLRRRQNLDQLIETVDKTLRLLEEDVMLSEAELYEGFTPEKIEEYRAEALKRWGRDTVDGSEHRVRSMSREAWQKVKEKAEQTHRALASYIGTDPGAASVQDLIADHHAWIETFYPCSAEIYQGLGRLYVEDEAFRAYYERYGAGMPEFMQSAMEIYAAHLEENLD